MASILILLVVLGSAINTTDDTDGDGLSDGEEVFRYGSNPRSSDTDSDGLGDRYEVMVIDTSPVMNWRDRFDVEAFKSGLCGAMREPVAQLSLMLEGNTTLDTVWNVLRWVDEHIEYNDAKALNKRTELQSPDETVTKRDGICSDYALLTASLLLNLDIQPVYMLDIKLYSDDEPGGHAAVAVKVNGSYFILDQHLPVTHIASYYYRNLYDCEEIQRIDFYAVNVTGEKATVQREESIYGYQLRDNLYRVTEMDLADIENSTAGILTQNYPWYSEDARLSGCTGEALQCSLEDNEDCSVYLPSGFSEGLFLSFSIPAYRYNQLLCDKEVERYLDSFDVDMANYERFYVRAGMRYNQTMKRCEGLYFSDIWANESEIVIVTTCAQAD